MKSRLLSRPETAPAPTDENWVLREDRGGVAVFTLNRPQILNALSSGVMTQLIKGLEDADRDPQIRVLILTGGPKVFAAGADIKEMAGMSAAQMVKRDMLKIWFRLAKISKPLIAAVNGFALGGGCELAMACDMIVAADDAVFGQPEILIGVMPGAGGTQRLVRLIGKSRALEFLWTGRRLNARTALEWGLVNAVVPAPLVLEEALRIAQEIAKNAPVAVRQIKTSVYAGLDMELIDGLAQERKRFYSLFDTQDQKEGMAAFLEKRKPTFHGK